MSASDIIGENSTTIKYDDLFSTISNVSQSASLFSSEIQKTSSDSNYAGLIDAGLDCGFVNEFDSNIDTIKDMLNSIVKSLNSALENMQQSEQAITDEMPELPQEENDYDNTEDILNDHSTSVEQENLENLDNEEENSEVVLENGENGEHVNLEDPNPEDTTATDIETSEEWQNEQNINLQNPEIQNSDLPSSFIPNATIFATIEFVCLNNLFKSILDYNKSENIDFIQFFSNQKYANKLKQLLVSVPGLSPELKNLYSSLDSIKLQQSFLMAINLSSSKNKLMELGYSLEIANAFNEFVMNNYLVK